MSGNASVVAAIAAWYSVHFISTSVSGSFLKHADLDHSTGTTLLTAAALLTGAAPYAGMCLVQLVQGKRAQRPSSDIVLASLLHLCAVYLVFVSMAQTSVWLTYSIKGLEPLFVLVLRVLIGECEGFGSTSVPALLALGLGAGLTVYRPDQDMTTSLVPGITAAIVSNLACGMRSILSRKIITNDNRTPTGLFCELSFWASVVYVPYLGLAWITGTHLLQPLGALPSAEALQVAVVGATHCGYYMASYVVLKHIPVVRHSILNVLKRIATIMVGITLLGEKCSPFNIAGSIFANVASYIIYLDHRSNDSPSMKGWSAKTNVLIRSLVALVCAFSVVSSLNMAGQDVFLTVQQQPSQPQHQQQHVVLSDHAASANAVIKPSAIDRDTRMAINTHKRLQCIQSAANTIMGFTRGVVGNRTKVALLDVACHPNLGDSLITVGELRTLTRAGFDVAYLCVHRNAPQTFAYVGAHLRTCDAKEVAEAIGPDGVAFYHGGGNWGDLWPPAQDNRMSFFTELVQAGVKNIAGFPQSFHYLTPQTQEAGVARDVKKMREWAEKNVSQTFMWRQKNSYETASKAYPDARNLLTPDIAWGIGPMGRTSEPAVDVLLLFRKDMEGTTDYKTANAKAAAILDQSNLTHQAVDWYALSDLPFQPRFAGQHMYYVPEVAMASAVSMLSLGKVLITNRLHATVLATLMGIPVFYLDNIYGKIAKTRAASLTHPSCDIESQQAWPFQTVEEAVKAAARYVQESSS